MLVRLARIENPPLGAPDRGLNAAIILSYIALGQGDNVSLLAFSNRMERAAGPVRGKAAIRTLIRQRGLAENRVQENEKKFRALYENAPLSYQSLDKDGCLLDVNPAWLETLGYQRDEVIGKYFADFLHPDWKPPV